MRFETAVLSEAGSRAENQDAVRHAVNGQRECWALADGLGGHGGGDRAARLAVEQVSAEKDIEAIFTDGQAAIHATQQADPGLGHMRTTLVAAAADTETGEARWAHVGDSRFYHFRSGAVAAQTRDHSFAQALVAAGQLAPEALRGHEDRNRLLRALGAGDTRPEIGEPATLAPGDALLLASDGFWEPVTEQEMAADLAGAATATDWLARLRARILSQSTEERDNLSAIAVFIHAH